MVNIKRGKLLDGSKEVKPEFGNKDHISAVKSAVEYAEELEKGIEAEFDFVEDENNGHTYFECGFACSCGSPVSIKQKNNSEDETELFGKTISCECGKDYIFFEDDEWGLLMVREDLYED